MIDNIPRSRGTRPPQIFLYTTVFKVLNISFLSLSTVPLNIVITTLLFVVSVQNIENIINYVSMQVEQKSFSEFRN